MSPKGQHAKRGVEERNMGREAIQAALVHQTVSHIPRGEIWLGRDILNNSGLGECMERRVRLCCELGMDALFFPVGQAPSLCRTYPHYSLEAVGEVVTADKFFIGVIIDRPFQQLARKMGFEVVSSSFTREAFAAELRKEVIELRRLVSACLDCRVDAVVLTDDIASQHGTFVRPSSLQRIVLPYYGMMVEQIHASHAYALFRSDGYIMDIIPSLIACGFDGLAACEVDCLDPLVLKQQYG